MSLAQRRNLNAQHVASIKKIASELVSSDHGTKLPVTCTNDADVDWNTGGVTDSDDLTLLDNAQKLRLCAHR